jgi:hypothetical protein
MCFYVCTHRRTNFNICVHALDIKQRLATCSCAATCASAAEDYDAIYIKATHFCTNVNVTVRANLVGAAQDKSGSLDYEEFFQGLAQANCAFSDEDNQLLWETLGGAEAGEVMYNVVTHHLQKANEDDLRSQRPKETQRLASASSSALDALKKKVASCERSHA